MRVSAAIWLVVGFICCLGQLPMSAKGNGNGRPSFSTKGATGGSYGAFIEALRAELIANRSTSNSRGIPVLSPSLTDSKRFVEVDLISNDKGVAANITLAIDAVNVYVVAYRSGDNCYFLSDAPNSTCNISFPNTTKKPLGFNGSYPSLEKAAGKYRDNINLGLNSLSDAIFTLSKTNSSQTQAAGLIVAIQMSSEAARFRFIERRMRFYIKYNQEKAPDAEIQELETSWSALSGQIQSVPEGRLAFNREVPVQVKNNSRIKVGTLLSPYVANVALLLYSCGLSKTIRMPLQLPVGADDLVALEDGSRNKACSIAEPTTWISGRDGLCVDVKNGGTKDGDLVQILACGNSNQNWTFYSDGTIKTSRGKCMVASGTSSGASVVVKSCSKPTSNLETWTSTMDGTFKISGSGLVLTAGTLSTTTANGTQLTVTTNRNTTYQGWNVGTQVDPFVTNIVGYDDLCLAGNRGDVVWIERCVVGNRDQEWALYNDGTIKVASNRNRCLTTPANSTNSPITIATCGISPNQRWVLTTEAKFLNPNANLVMEVKNSNPSLKEIILSAPTKGKASQEWLPFLII